MLNKNFIPRLLTRVVVVMLLVYIDQAQKE